MISRGDGSENESGYPWSDDRTTTKYEAAQLRYLQRNTQARSTPPPPPPPRVRVAALEPAPEIELQELDFLESTERTENPFVEARSATRARLSSAFAVACLLGAVLFTRVLLYSATSAEHTLDAAAPTPPPTAASAEPETQQPPAARAELENPWQLPATAAQPHKSATKHAPAPKPETDAVIAPSSKPEPEPALTGFGTLRINSRPWSQVFVDGQLHGNTPQLGIRLPAGHHTLRLVNPEFNMTKTIEVDVSPGENLSRVETLED